jgi:transcriptional regulator with XRE-family HTH domain
MPHLHLFVAFLQYASKSLKSLRPVPYLRNPKTLAEHLLKKRFESKLRQQDVAELMGVGLFTYLTWETGKVKNPEIRMWKHIIEFLGYDPHSAPKNFAGRLIEYRRKHGFSQKKLARLVGCDEGSLARWEKRYSKPHMEQHLIILSNMELL